MKRLEVQACFIAGVISDLSYFTYKPWTLVKRMMFCKTKYFLLNIPLSAPDLAGYALTHVNFAFYFSWIVMILFTFKTNWWNMGTCKSKHESYLFFGFYQVDQAEVNFLCLLGKHSKILPSHAIIFSLRELFTLFQGQCSVLDRSLSCIFWKEHCPGNLVF